MMEQVSRRTLFSMALAALLVAGGGIAVANGAPGPWTGTLYGSTGSAHATPTTPAPQVGSLPSSAAPGHFTTEQFTSAQGQRMTYYLYVPASYSATAHYPLVLLLHGGGERSSASSSAGQNRALLLGQQYVQDWIAPAVQRQWPSFVVVPQVPGSAQWVDVPASQGPYTLRSQPTLSLRLAMDIVVTLQRAYSTIDGNRVYLTGLSMGGYGAWDAAERWPSLFAAAVPLAGGGDPRQARALVSLPLWAFHGAADTAVPVSGSRQMISAIRAAGGSPCYTEYAGQEHGIWNTNHVYENATLLRWLFSQTRAPGGAGSQQPLSCPSA